MKLINIANKLRRGVYKPLISINWDEMLVLIKCSLNFQIHGIVFHLPSASSVHYRENTLTVV